MRRVLIVSIAILTLFASSAVMAGEQQVSDRLLEILKERQIISENEFAELSDLADQMTDDQTAVDQQLEALDASISEYLAKEGDDDEAGVAVTHQKGAGFGFSTGTFELFIGGLFQFEYYGLDVDDGRDTNNFRVKEARFDFTGKAFVEGFTYKFQWQANGAVTLLDAWMNYVVTDGFQFKFGQFKAPYSRQYLNSAGKLELMDRSITTDEFNIGRDIGLMGHDVLELGEDGDMAVEYALAFVNGDGANVQGNDNNWLGVVARLGFYPMGFVKYGESDLANTQDVKFGIAGSYYTYRNRPTGSTTKTTGLGLDGVVAWSGLYVTAEWHSREVEPDDGSTSFDDKGWFAQAGFVIPDTEFEIIGRYSHIDWDSAQAHSSSAEWQLGVAWYPGQEGHPFKALLSFGQARSDESNSAAAAPSKSEDYGLAGISMDQGDTFFVRIAFQLDW